MISKRAGEPCIIQTFRQGGLTTPVLRHAGPQFVANVPLTRGPLAGMHAPARFACAVAAVSLLSARTLDAQTLDRRQIERIEQTLRQEGAGGRRAGRRRGRRRARARRVHAQLAQRLPQGPDGHVHPVRGPDPGEERPGRRRAAVCAGRTQPPRRRRQPRPRPRPAHHAAGRRLSLRRDLPRGPGSGAARPHCPRLFTLARPITS